jgi:hypothetical protein
MWADEVGAKNCSVEEKDRVTDRLAKLNKKVKLIKPGVVLPISDSSTWEPKAGGLQVWSQPGLK